MSFHCFPFVEESHNTMHYYVRNTVVKWHLVMEKGGEPVASNYVILKSDSFLISSCCFFGNLMCIHLNHPGSVVQEIISNREKLLWSTVLNILKIRAA